MLLKLFFIVIKWHINNPLASLIFYCEIDGNKNKIEIISKIQVAQVKLEKNLIKVKMKTQQVTICYK